VEIDSVPVLSAVPTGPHRGGVVILPEIWGLSPFIHEQVSAFAARGFAAAAPSLYTIDGPDVAGDKDTAFQRLADLDDAEVIRRIEIVARAIGSAGPVFAVGYCLGARCALQALLDRPQLLSGAVAFGPTGLVATMTGRLTPLLPRLPELTRPLLLIVGDDDPYLPLTDVEQVRTALATGEAATEVLVCEGAGHGFHNPLRPGYRAGPAQLARDRFEAWLDVQAPDLRSETR
jgi:carboxymethylenebutenolidase